MTPVRLLVITVVALLMSPPDAQPPSAAGSITIEASKNAAFKAGKALKDALK